MMGPRNPNVEGGYQDNIRQQSHRINLPYPQSQQEELHNHIEGLHPQKLAFRSVGFEFSENRVCVDQALDGSLEEHKDHHNTEDLETIAGHIHHDRVHRELFGGREGDLPSLFQFESIRLDGLLGGGGCLGVLLCAL